MTTFLLPHEISEETLMQAGYHWRDYLDGKYKILHTPDGEALSDWDSARNHYTLNVVYPLAVERIAALEAQIISTVYIVTQVQDDEDDLTLGVYVQREAAEALVSSMIAADVEWEQSDPVIEKHEVKR